MDCKFFLWEMGNGKWEMGNGKWEMGNVYQGRTLSFRVIMVDRFGYI